MTTTPKRFATALMIAVLATSGCYTVKFNSPEAAATPSGSTIHVWTHSFFWGLIPMGAASLDQCGDAGIKRIKSQIGGLGLLAYAFTGGIWTPMHVKIVCAAPKTAAVDGFEADPDGLDGPMVFLEDDLAELDAP